LLAPSFNFLFLLAGAGGDDDDDDDDGDVEDTDDKDVNNDDDALSSSSILFSKMKFHINGSTILPNDCVYSVSVQSWGGCN
jgi:hypothetical protein